MDYEKKVMEISYKILMEEDFEWSSDFKYDMRFQLLKLLIEYFEDIEDYEKCAKLHSMLDQLENRYETINKTITTGSGEL